MHMFIFTIESINDLMMEINFLFAKAKNDLLKNSLAQGMLSEENYSQT